MRLFTPQPDTTEHLEASPEHLESGHIAPEDAGSRALCKISHNLSYAIYSVGVSVDIIPKHKANCKPIPDITEHQKARFWSKVAIRGPQECWLWTGARAPAHRYSPHVFYGKFRIGRTVFGAHRIAYFLTYGPIPDGWTVDHVKAWGCTETLCCNPWHLQRATLLEQVQRRDAGKPPTCRWGHRKDKWSHCSKCQELHQARFILKHREQYSAIRIAYAEKILAANPQFAQSERQRKKLSLQLSQ